MKKILLILILSLLTNSIVSDKAKCKIDQKSLTPFTIMAIGSLEKQKDKSVRVDYEKPSPIVIYKDGQYTFYEFEEVNNDKHYYRPKHDSNGEPIPIKPDDPNFFPKIWRALQNHYVYGEIIGPQNLIAISIMAHYPKKEEYFGFWNTTVYTKYSRVKHWEYSNVVTGSKIDYPVGSIYYLDDDYNTELQVKTKSSYKVEKREAINPDLVNDVYLIPYLRSLEALNTKPWLGYLWMKVGYDDVFIGGYKYGIAKPMIYNGKLIVSLYHLIDYLDAVIDYDNTTDRHIAYKVIKPAWSKIEIIKLELKIGDKKAYLNGEKIELSFAPFELEGDRNNAIYVSATDICDIFKAKLHWRSLDNTALIERFPTRF